MLTQLSVENYALIDKLNIHVDRGLSIITGETGAGKSILLGALSLLLGSRADVQALFDKNRKCIVEGEFQIANIDLQEFFDRNELDYEDSCLIRREINPQGKSRAFINDTPVTLNVLKELTERLIDIHSQHKTLEINDLSFQVSVIDSFAGQAEGVRKYKTAYRKYRELKKSLEELELLEQQQRKDQDYFQFQFNELEQAQLKEGEQESLEQEMDFLNHAESVKQHISLSASLLSEGEDTILSRLNQLQQSLSQAARHDERLKPMENRLESILIDLRDLSLDVVQHAEKVQLDPERTVWVSQRLDGLYRLMQKHQVNDILSLVHLMKDMETKLLDLDDLDQQIQNIRIELDKQFLLVNDLASDLSAKRRKVIPQARKKIQDLLKSLGMPDAQIDIQCEDAEEIGWNGKDRILFLFTANKGSELQMLSRVASGGELSRLMLAVKSLISQSNLLPTIIFDEIDSGVSGEVAGKVGEILYGLSREMQVIAITHLPQIAARGDQHLYVYKKSGPEQTHTFIRTLSDEERVEEIARMISGNKVSENTLETARELIRRN